MKLQQINEYEYQLNEASRSKVFKIVGSIFGLAGGTWTFAVLAGLGIGGALPLAIISGAIYGVYLGGIATIFAKGKQRTLYDSLLKQVKNRDLLISDIKSGKEASEKQIKKLDKLSSGIKTTSEQLDKLLDFGKGGAGLLRREVSPKEKEQIRNVIKAGKGESGDLLSFKYNIDPKKIK